MADDWALDMFIPAVPSRYGGPASPAAQGSKRPVGFRTSKAGKPVPVLREESRAVGPWRQRVAEVAAIHWRSRALLDGPIHLEGHFVLHRPAYLRRNPTTPATKRHHDGDKMDRALWDGLTGVIFRDDSQIVTWAGSKRIAEPGEPTGCRVRIRRVSGLYRENREAYGDRRNGTVEIGSAEEADDSRSAAQG